MIASMNGRVPAALIGFILCFGGFISRADTVAEAREHAEKGVQSARSGDLISAEAELQRAVELAPEDASYLTSLGGILGMEQKFAEANVYFERAVERDRTNAAARRNLAANEWRLGQFKQAQANLEMLLRIQPQDKVAKLLLGMVSENQHDYARAAKLLGGVPELVEQQPESIAALASAYYHTERREEAHKTLALLLTRTDASPQGIFAAAGVAAQVRDYRLAEQLFDSIRYKYPDTAALQYNLALIQFRTGRITESQRTLLEAVHSGPGKAEIYNLLGTVETKMDLFTDAIKSYSRAIELDPNSIDAEVGLASARWAAGMHSEAEAQFQLLLKRHPREAIVYESYGTSLLGAAGDDAMFRRAADLLKKAASLDASRAETHYQLGLLELKRNEAEVTLESLRQALGELQTAARLGLNDSKIHYALARVYRRLGREAEATSEMQLYQKLKESEGHSNRNGQPGGLEAR
ncbi:MAG TPA: tetratricopeptide repeat protein [Bryobacteraceae bacterium]|jgi:tetratricopeptide (TPR) repeat protein